MLNRDSSWSWPSLAGARAALCAVAALLLAAVLAGCAGEPPTIGSRSAELLVNPAWSADGSSIVAYSRLHNRTLLFDVKSGTSRVVNIKDSYAWPMEFSSDGKLILGRSGVTVEAWQANSGQLAWGWVGGVGFSIACVSGAQAVIAAGREVVLLDAASGKVRAVLGAEPYPAASGAVCSADRRFLARQYGEGVVSVWDIAARSKLGVLKVPAGDERYTIALGPGAGQLALWTGGHVRLYRRDAWPEPGREPPPDDVRPAADIPVSLRQDPSLMGRDLAMRHDIAFSPDGRYLVVAGQRKGGGLLPKLELVLVKLEGLQVTPLPEFGDFAFSPDSTRLAIAWKLRIWDIRSGAFVTYPQR